MCNCYENFIAIRTLHLEFENNNVGENLQWSRAMRCFFLSSLLPSNERIKDNIVNIIGLENEGKGKQENRNRIVVQLKMYVSEPLTKAWEFRTLFYYFFWASMQNLNTVSLIIWKLFIISLKLLKLCTIDSYGKSRIVTLIDKFGKEKILATK